MMSGVRDHAKDATRKPSTASDMMAEDSTVPDSRTSTIVVRVIWYVMGFILVLLAFRFMLPLFGANLNTGFANGIFGVTAPFVSPFSGLFRNIPLSSVVELEPNVLVAIAVYALVAWGLVKLVTIAR